MNGRKAKALRKKARSLLIEWVRSFVPETEDISRINEDNLKEFLPEQTHLYANKKLLLSAYSLRWFYKKVKQKPDITLQEITK
tara:strand:- start:94 stop:342 length:249 start_codon:yes stop_codon:yes gene_type:complete